MQDTAALYMDTTKQLFRLDRGTTSYQANRTGAYVINMTTGACTPLPAGLNYANITTGLIGMTKSGTPRPMDYQATFEIINHEYARAGDEYETFMGAMQWVDGTRWVGVAAGSHRNMQG